MKRKIFYFLGFVIISLVSCSKGDDATTTTPPPNNKNIDPVGVWRFESSVSTQYGNTFTIDTIKYPCTVKNILIINSDGTAIASYTGNDTCFIQNTPTLVSIMGLKGESRSGTWTRSENTLTTILPNSSTTNPVLITTVGQLSIVNGKYKLTSKVTYPSIDYTLISTSTK